MSKKRQKHRPGPPLTVVPKPNQRGPSAALSSSAHDIDSLKELLAPFLASHPDTGYQGHKGYSTLERPWNDDSLLLTVTPDDAELVDALNRLFLPQRYSAIWHRKTKQLEFIFTMLPADNTLRSRSFQFTLGSKTYNCRFDDSSKELLMIAKAARFSPPASSTQYRNLLPLQLHLLLTGQQSMNTIPTSFWVDPIAEWDDNFIADLSSHLNFYMAYFDHKSPRVLIHEESPGPVKESTYPHGVFPLRIDGRSLDTHLMMVWQSVLAAPDPFRKFLYAYQVLEYAAFYCVQEKVMQSLTQILAAPDCIGQIGRSVREIFDVVTDVKTPDEQKMQHLLRAHVKADNVWQQIEPNAQYFTKEISFDGGLTVEPLLQSGPTRSAFEDSWPMKFELLLRKLRNALVHGRESRQSYAVAPTQANHERLRPWLGPIVVAAQEATLFSAC